MSTNKLTQDDIDKIGNMVIYLTERVKDLTKTKLLKLIYLIEVNSVIQYQTPFLGLPFYVWKHGPVEKDIYKDLDVSNEYSFLKEYVDITKDESGRTYIHDSKKKFVDDEFSENDIDIMDFVIDKYGTKNANELSTGTHGESTAWYKFAKDNGLLELFDSNQINTSDVEIDFGFYLTGCQNILYKDNLDFLSSSKYYKK